jgi:FkbM family methyltransferase
VATQALAFDRTTGRFTGANWVERIAAVAMQLGAKATAPIHHRGLSLGCRILRTGLVAREITVALAEDSRFSFPFGDGYWTRLLDGSSTYEPEVDAFLRGIAGVDYDFIDCGANFGFWSILVSSRGYGRHACLAIEASPVNATRLAANARLNGGRFRVLHSAISGKDGGTAWIAGSKHEGMSIAHVPAGGGDEVGVVSLDGLLARGEVRADRPLVVKLDVEGVEVEAMQGAERLLRGDVALICEDHGADPTHRVTRHLLENTRCAVFVFNARSRSYDRLTDIGALGALKAAGPPGYNVFALTPFWERQLFAAGMIQT